MSNIEHIRAFADWYGSPDYEKQVGECHLGVSITTDYPSGEIACEIKNVEEFAEVCFRAGEKAEAKRKGCSLVNCNGRENSIRLRKAEEIIKGLIKTVHWSDEASDLLKCARLFIGEE